MIGAFIVVITFSIGFSFCELWQLRKSRKRTMELIEQSDKRLQRAFDSLMAQGVTLPSQQGDRLN